jgi:hypothetical protein
VRYGHGYGHGDGHGYGYGYGHVGYAVNETLNETVVLPVPLDLEKMGRSFHDPSGNFGGRSLLLDSGSYPAGQSCLHSPVESPHSSAIAVMLTSRCTPATPVCGLNIRRPLKVSPLNPTGYHKIV